MPAQALELCDHMHYCVILLRIGETLTEQVNDVCEHTCFVKEVSHKEYFMVQGCKTHFDTMITLH